MGMKEETNVYNQEPVFRGVARLFGLKTQQTGSKSFPGRNDSHKSGARKVNSN